jgi:hypothetical protein
MEHERGAFKVNQEITLSWVKEKAANAANAPPAGSSRPSNAANPAGKLDKRPFLLTNRACCR